MTRKEKQQEIKKWHIRTMKTMIKKTWIPISKTIPYSDSAILATYRDGTIFIIEADSAIDDDEVLAWMPLPEPYNPKKMKQNLKDATTRKEKERYIRDIHEIERFYNDNSAFFRVWYDRISKLIGRDFDYIYSISELTDYQLNKMYDEWSKQYKKWKYETNPAKNRR